MPRKVLVADDSVTIQKVVGITFASEDIALSFVDNGEEAITLARQIRPDLIIADVLMPRKTGYEVCEAIKQDPELSHIPVLLLTGTFEPFDAERSRRVGADGTITKPFESQTLIRQVNALLDRAAPVAQTAEPAPVAAPATAAAAAPMNEAESAFADLSRDLELEPLPSSAQSEPPSAPAPLLPEPGTPVDDAFDFDFESGGSFSFEEGAAPSPAPGPAEAAAAADAPRLSEREEDFEFVEEPGEVLELGEPAHAVRAETAQAQPERPYGAGEPPAADLFADTPAPETAEVWNLSDLEAVEESAVEEPAPPAQETESPTFWDDAAAEAIDLVESVSVDAPEDILLPEGEATEPGLSAAEESPQQALAAEPEQDDMLEDAGLDLPMTGIDDGLVLDGEAQRAAAAAVHPSIEDLPEFDFEADALGEPLDTGEPLEAIPELEPEAESFAPEPSAPAVGTAADPGADAVNEVVRRAVNDAVERVTWEAFSDLSETVVKAVKEKVEQIAWEVIPQMAEALIKEEIKRISEEKK